MTQQWIRRTVRLKSGGELTFHTAGLEVFRLSPKDRAFILGLVHAIEEYERERDPDLLAPKEA